MVHATEICDHRYKSANYGEESKVICEGVHSNLSILARRRYPLHSNRHEQPDELFRHRLIHTVRRDRKSITRKALTRVVARESETAEVEKLQRESVLYRSDPRIGR